MKWNAPTETPRAHRHARGKKALSCALAAVLVVGLMPTLGFAEAGQDVKSDAMDVSGAYTEGAEGTTNAQAGAVPLADDASAEAAQNEGGDSASANESDASVELLSLSANASGEGESDNTQSGRGGAEESIGVAGASGSIAEQSAAAESVASEQSGSSESGVEGGDVEDEQEAGDDVAQSANPFKEGVDAQPLANLENYYGRDHDPDFKAKAWKTSVGCTGKKLWIGNIRNDDGFFAPGVEEPSLSYSGPTTSEYDAEIYAYVEQGYTNTVDGQPRDVVFVYGDCGLSSVDFFQVFDGSYDVYVPMFAFSDTNISSVVFPSFVKELNQYAFYAYQSNGLSSVEFQTDDQGNGIQRICSSAFTNNKQLSSQGQIVIPSSILYLEGGAFSEYDGALNVRVENPDVRFGDEYTEDNSADNPFTGGGTVAAYRWKNDRETPSDAWVLSQSKNAPSNITWLWLDDYCCLKGSLKLPDGIGQSQVQIKVEQGQSSSLLTLDQNNAFSCDKLFGSTLTTVTVSIQGYYDTTYTRYAVDMNGDWDLGEIDASSFAKIPAQRVYPLTVNYETSSKDENGQPVCLRVTNWDEVAFEVRNGDTLLEQGEDADYVAHNGTIVLSDELAAADAVRNMVVKAMPVAGQALSAAEATYNEDDGFTVTLPRWGTALVKTTCSEAADAALAGRARVMVFSGTDDSAPKVFDKYTTISGLDEQGGTETWSAETDSLQAGTYTIVAFDASGIDASPTNLRSARNLGIRCAEEAVEVADSTQVEATLDVPAYDSNSLLGAVGLKSVSIRVNKTPVLVGCETILSIDYQCSRSAAKTLKLGIAQQDISDLSVTVGSQKVDATVDDDGISISLPESDESSTVSVAFKPTKAQTYAAPLTASSNGVTAALGNASFIAVDAYIGMASQFVSQANNSATVYAAPGKRVQLKVGDIEVGEEAWANELGRASISFDMPESVTKDLLYGDAVKLEAVIDYGDDQTSCFANCTWRPSARLWSFKITNDGATQSLVENGEKKRSNSLVLHYQFARQTNAYWTFDLTAKNMGSEMNAGDSMMLFVETEGGDTVPIALTKKSDDGTYARFVGEYVDEAYLALLEKYPSVTFFYSELIKQEMGNFFIPKNYSFSAFDLTYASNVDDDYLQRATDRAQQEIADRYAYLDSLFDFDATSGYDEEVESVCDDTLDVMKGFVAAIEQGRANGDYSEDEAVAAIEKIEALMPDFEDPTATFLTRDENTWVSNIDNDTFTGATFDPVVWEAPTDAEIDGWYAGEDDATKSAVKSYFANAKQAIERNNESVQSGQNVVRNTVKSIMDIMGLTDSTATDSPYEWLDQNVDASSLGDLTISTGSSASGEADASAASGRFSADFYIGKDGDGKPTSYTTVVTEDAPSEYAGAASKTQCYLLDNTKSHGYMDNWEQDTKKMAHLNAIGELSNQVFDYAAKNMRTTETAIEFFRVADQLPPSPSTPGAFKVNLTKTPVNKVTEAAEKVAESQKQQVQVITQTKSLGANAQSFAKAVPLVGTIFDAMGLGNTIDSWSQSMDDLGSIEADINCINQWILFWMRHKPCNSDCAKCIAALRAELAAAENLKAMIEIENNINERETSSGMYTLMAKVAAGMVALGGVEGAATASDLGGKATLMTDIGSAAGHYYTATLLDELRNKYEQATRYREAICKETVDNDKSKDPEDNSKSGDIFRFDSNVIIDPSGVVYEAVESNVVEGATATVYTRGAAGEQAWNAEAYEQINPQVTGADGSFAWDVPTGMYQVRVSKDGYEPASTEWLSVLPIQTGLKLGLKSTEAPQAQAVAGADFIEVSFSQYMKADDYLMPEIDGVVAERIEWVDAEMASEADGGAALSKTLRAYPASSLVEGSTVTLRLSGAKNYAGRELGEGGVWSQEVAVVKRPATLVANFENSVVAKSGDSVKVVAYVRYADGSPVANEAVSASVGSSDIAALSVPSATTDAEGKAEFELTGDLPGMTTLSLSVEGAPLSKELPVRVTSDAARPIRPVATIGEHEFGALSPKENAITVKKGSQLVLSTATEGATIYYTVDDTCPCKSAEEGGTRIEYTGPIDIPEGVTKYRIAAYKQGMSFDEYSERLNITVTVDDSEDPNPAPIDPTPTPDSPNDEPMNPSQSGGGNSSNGDQQGGASSSANASSGVNGAANDTVAQARDANMVLSGATYAPTGDANARFGMAVAAIAALATVLGLFAVRRRNG